MAYIAYRRYFSQDNCFNIHVAVKISHDFFFTWFTSTTWVTLNNYNKVVTLRRCRNNIVMATLHCSFLCLLQCLIHENLKYMNVFEVFDVPDVDHFTAKGAVRVRSAAGNITVAAQQGEPFPRCGYLMRLEISENSSKEVFLESWHLKYMFIVQKVALDIPMHRLF